MESLQPPARRRLLKSGRILLGMPFLTRFAIIQRPVLAYRFRPRPAFPWRSTSSKEVI